MDDSFYDDSKTVSYVYPDLKKGGKTRLNYTYQIKNPRFLNAFYFGDYFPIVYNKVTIIADKGVKLAFKEFQTEGENISYTKKNKGRTVVHTWVLENQEEFEPESNAPNYKTILPPVMSSVSSLDYPAHCSHAEQSFVVHLDPWRWNSQATDSPISKQRCCLPTTERWRFSAKPGR